MPGRNTGIDDYILCWCLSRYTKRSTHEIYLRLLQEYGSVSEMTVQRAVRRLEAEGRVIAVREGGTIDWGYLLPKQ